MSEHTESHRELSEIPGAAWAMLRRAVKDRKHAFRTPVLCTVDADDGSPRARTVVLRHADPEGLVLRCHTDRRAGKIEQIGREPMVAWLFYDAKARVQLRIRARARVHLEGEVFEEAWARTALMSRRCYLAPSVPGVSAEGPSANLPEDLLECEPDFERSEEGRVNFAAIETRVIEMDWLYLRHSGHVRAGFVWGEDGKMSRAEWREP
jgi:3-hydroxyisobutyrate dehydrogenase